MLEQDLLLVCGDSPSCLRGDVELKAKLKCLQDEHKRTRTALEAQCTENVKVSVCVCVCVCGRGEGGGGTQFSMYPNQKATIEIPNYL